MIVEIVLDTETTGLDYTREKMVEFAAVRLENGKIKAGLKDIPQRLFYRVLEAI